jgi:hypothetical protein
MMMDRAVEAAPVARVDWARLRVQLCYLWRHRRPVNLHSPARFSELVQVRKLTDRDPAMPPRLDKVAVKRIVAQELGSEFITPTIWSGESLPPPARLRGAAILKTRHGCNQFHVLRSTPTHSEWGRLQRRTRAWTKAPYGGWLDEWAYDRVPRGLLLEPLLGNGAVLPIDFKVFVFGGRATHVQVHIGRGTRHRWILHDRNWRKLIPSQPDSPARPRSLTGMLEAAERLAARFSFARIDFFEVDGNPRFGEYSFYPGSGLDPFEEEWIDFELGKLWRAALPSCG